MLYFTGSLRTCCYADSHLRPLAHASYTRSTRLTPGNLAERDLPPHPAGRRTIPTKQQHDLSQADFHLPSQVQPELRQIRQYLYLRTRICVSFRTIALENPPFLRNPDSDSTHVGAKQRESYRSDRLPWTALSSNPHLERHQRRTPASQTPATFQRTLSDTRPDCAQPSDKNDRPPVSICTRVPVTKVNSVLLCL